MVSDFLGCNYLGTFAERNLRLCHGDFFNGWLTIGQISLFFWFCLGFVNVGTIRFLVLVERFLLE